MEYQAPARPRCPSVRPVSDGDRALLREIVARRHAALLDRVEDVGRRPLSAHTLEQLRIAVVDEACETPETTETARRILDLEDLLAGLVAEPPQPTRERPPR